tara:strand:+ start:677 stop:1036 length:360 start_codon:yes stop_codon:yes gene_type:complete
MSNFFIKGCLACIFFLSFKIDAEEYVCTWKDSFTMETIKRNDDHFILVTEDNYDLRVDILKENKNFLTLYNADENVNFDQTVLLLIIDKQNLIAKGWFLSSLTSDKESTSTGKCVFIDD